MEQFSIDACMSKLKFFTCDSSAKFDYHCNYIMLLFGTNKKLFNNGYKNVDFVNDTKDWIIEKFYLANNMKD